MKFAFVRSRATGFALACALVIAATLGGTHAPARAGTLVLYEIDDAFVRVVDAHSGALLRVFSPPGPAEDIAVGKDQTVAITSTAFATGGLIVSRYAPDVDRPFATIGLEPAVGHVAFSVAGELAVTMDCDSYGGGTCLCPRLNRILFFEAGAPHPTRAVKYCGRHFGLGFSKPAYAPDGTLWVRAPASDQDDFMAYVEPGGTTYHAFKLATNAGSVGPPDAVLDAAGNILAIYRYPHPFVRAWNARTGKPEFGFAIDGLFNGVSRFAVSPDGQNLFVSSVDGFVLVFRYPMGGKPVAAYRVGGSGIFALGYV